MNVSGALVLMISFGILIFVGMGAVGGIYEDSGINESSDMYQSMEGSKEATNVIFTVFGYLLMGIGVFATIKAFNLM
ncbi:hypothetical protein [Methanococcoides sp. FTZ1]|uniref:hypothetical protein n=1 Tax=Methanococcoides sp. FTZ1 TaxID=3439061 RepID=UPI003F82EBFA